MAQQNNPYPKISLDQNMLHDLSFQLTLGFSAIALFIVDQMLEARDPGKLAINSTSAFCIIEGVGLLILILQARRSHRRVAELGENLYKKQSLTDNFRALDKPWKPSKASFIQGWALAYCVNALIRNNFTIDDNFLYADIKQPFTHISVMLFLSIAFNLNHTYKEISTFNSCADRLREAPTPRR